MPQKKISAEARYSRKRYAEDAEIGELPEVADWTRRRACGLSLMLFLQVYFPNSCGLSVFSADHMQMIDSMESCIIGGGRYANAVYRGFAKTSCLEGAAIWALAYGYRSFAELLGATQPNAEEMIDSISKELSENELLIEDFPEVCVPFVALEGKKQRAFSQTYLTDPTFVRMTKTYICLPMIRRADGTFWPSSGGVIRAKGLLGAGRGKKFKTPDGRGIRPDFTGIDDPQTDDSAKQPGQVTKRMKVTRKGILQGGSHRKSSAVVVNGTVIECDDFMEQLLSDPSFDGVRIPMVKSWSNEHEGLWQEYKRLRHSYSKDITGDKDRAHREANEFYAANQSAMDAGAVVSWKSCFNETEISAIQHAYNILFDDGPVVFAAEYQQQPLREQVEGIETLVASKLATRTNGYAKCTLPPATTAITAFCDVHDDVLYWLVTAWGERFSGWVIDYGTFPQQAGYFEKRTASATLERMWPAATIEERVRLGVRDVERALMSTRYKRLGGGELGISRLLIDCGHKLHEVAHVARTSPVTGQITLSRGIGVKASDTPFVDRKRADGVVVGDDWYTDPFPKNGTHPVTFFDTNAWKSFLHARLVAPVAGEGAITFYGTEPHQLFADHLCSEFPTKTFGKGRSLYEWALLPGRDNHWLDCMVGCCVGASMQGISLAGRLSNAIAAHQPRQINDWFKNQKRNRR